MSECFVIQPFDNDKFDRRFAETFEPAIKAAGYEPYRVDKDPAVNDLVQGIKEGIERANAIFAELTTDNPNVWFELGYALAKNKPFCMVCSDERGGGKYPFDVRTLKILPYRTGSKGDFLKIENDIADRLNAVTSHPSALNPPPSVPSNVDGLSDLERDALAFVLEDHLSGGQSLYELQSKMERVRYTKGATTYAVLNLRQKKMVEMRDTENYNGETYSAAFLTDDGLAWLQRHPESLVIQHPQK